jgi:hypothetical protein
MKTVDATEPTRNPLGEFLGAAFAFALRQPEVIAAIREVTTSKPPELVSDGDRLLAKRELARKLGVSPSTVDRLTRDGLPIAAHVGDARRFDLAACRAWLAARGKKATKAPASARAVVDVSDVIEASGLKAAR